MRKKLQKRANQYLDRLTGKRKSGVDKSIVVSNRLGDIVYAASDATPGTLKVRRLSGSTVSVTYKDSNLKGPEDDIIINFIGVVSSRGYLTIAQRGNYDISGRGKIELEENLLYLELIGQDIPFGALTPALNGMPSLSPPGLRNRLDFVSTIAFDLS
jgi:hypothetical protein